MAQGIPAEMLLAVESRGERDPVVPTAAPERLNRRAVTVVGRPGRPGTGLDRTHAARIYDAYQAGRIGATEAEPITVNWLRRSGNIHGDGLIRGEQANRFRGP